MLENSCVCSPYIADAFAIFVYCMQCCDLLKSETQSIQCWEPVCDRTDHVSDGNNMSTREFVRFYVIRCYLQFSGIRTTVFTFIFGDKV